MTPEALAALHKAAFTDLRPWSAAEFKDLLSQSGMILCGDAKSFVLGRQIGDEAEVLTLATHPGHLRKGYAARHLATFIGQLKASGVTRVFLEVAENNQPAKALYINNNFYVVGHRKQYYAGANGDKIGADVMERRLEA